MSDADYYSGRAQQEREAALKAEHQEARAAHLELASAYELRAQNVKAKGRRSTLHILGAG